VAIQLRGIGLVELADFVAAMNPATPARSRSGDVLGAAMHAIINGLKIHYVIEGTGIACVIPSLAGTPIYERTFSANLRRHLKLVFVRER